MLYKTNKGKPICDICKRPLRAQNDELVCTNYQCKMFLVDFGMEGDYYEERNHSKRTGHVQN